MPVAVAAGGPGLVAVGDREFRDPETPAGGTAGAWYSVDGRAWERATPDGLAVGDGMPSSGPTAGLVDVAWGPAGYVAVGYAYEEAAGTVSVVGGAWHSADGRAWSRSGDPFWNLARPTAVTWNGTRYVVVGVVEEQAAPRAAAWSSRDGKDWSRAPDAPVFDVGDYMDTLEYHAWGGPQEVTSSDGVTWAVGRTCKASATLGDDVCVELVWRSGDATTWTREELGAAASDTALGSIAVVGGQVVAVGGPSIESGIPGNDPARVLVRRSNGWERVEPPGIPRLEQVIPFGTGFAAASGTGLWTSPSGLTWAAVAGPPSSTVRAFDIAQLGARLIGVGWTEGVYQGNSGGFAVLWAPAAT